MASAIGDALEALREAVKKEALDQFKHREASQNLIRTVHLQRAEHAIGRLENSLAGVAETASSLHSRCMESDETIGRLRADNERLRRRNRKLRRTVAEAQSVIQRKVVENNGLLDVVKNARLKKRAGLVSKTDASVNSSGSASAVRHRDGETTEQAAVENVVRVGANPQSMTKTANVFDILPEQAASVVVAAATAALEAKRNKVKEPTTTHNREQMELERKASDPGSKWTGFPQTDHKADPVRKERDRLKVTKAKSAKETFVSRTSSAAGKHAPPVHVKVEPREDSPPAASAVRGSPRPSPRISKKRSTSEIQSSPAPRLQGAPSTPLGRSSGYDHRHEQSPELSPELVTPHENVEQQRLEAANAQENEPMESCPQQKRVRQESSSKVAVGTRGVEDVVTDAAALISLARYAMGGGTDAVTGTGPGSGDSKTRRGARSGFVAAADGSSTPEHPDFDFSGLFIPKVSPAKHASPGLARRNTAPVSSSASLWDDDEARASSGKVDPKVRKWLKKIPSAAGAGANNHCDAANGDADVRANPLSQLQEFGGSPSQIPQSQIGVSPTLAPKEQIVCPGSDEISPTQLPTKLSQPQPQPTSRHGTIGSDPRSDRAGGARCGVSDKSNPHGGRDPIGERDRVPFKLFGLASEASVRHAGGGSGASAVAGAGAGVGAGGVVSKMLECIPVPLYENDHGIRTGILVPADADMPDMEEAMLGSKRPRIAYKEVIRGKAAREDLRAFECADCERFYDQMGISKAQRLECRNECSRHRHRTTPTNTPPGYWDIESDGDRFFDRDQQV